MLKILGRTDSINVRKVLWLLTDLDLAYEHESWGAGHRSTFEPSFMQLNPNALVPVMLEDGFVLWESNTICRYLAGREQRTDLLPNDLRARAIVEQWMDWQLGDLNNAWRTAFLGLVKKLPAYSDPAAIAGSAKRWNEMMGVLDAQLDHTGAFVTGSEFTLADINVGLCVNRWRATPMDKPMLPAVEAYFDRLHQRPGFVAHGDNGMP